MWFENGEIRDERSSRLVWSAWGHDTGVYMRWVPSEWTFYGQTVSLCDKVGRIRLKPKITPFRIPVDNPEVPNGWALGAVPHFALHDWLLDNGYQVPDQIMRLLREPQKNASPPPVSATRATSA